MRAGTADNLQGKETRPGLGHHSSRPSSAATASLGSIHGQDMGLGVRGLPAAASQHAAPLEESLCDAPTGLHDQPTPSFSMNLCRDGEGSLHLPLTPTCEAVSAGTAWGWRAAGSEPPCWPRLCRVAGPRGPGTGSPFVSVALASDRGPARSGPVTDR